VVLTVVGTKGHWTPHVMRTCITRMRPYLRSIPDGRLFPTTCSAVGYLEGRGILYRASSQTWKISPEGFKIFDKHIGPAWLQAASAK
jgi:hypothetical protein